MCLVVFVAEQLIPGSSVPSSGHAWCGCETAFRKLHKELSEGDGAALTCPACSGYLLVTIHSIPVIFYTYNSSCLLLVNYHLFKRDEQEADYSADISSLFKTAFFSWVLPRERMCVWVFSRERMCVSVPVTTFTAGGCRSGSWGISMSRSWCHQLDWGRKEPHKNTAGFNSPSWVYLQLGSEYPCS